MTSVIITHIKANNLSIVDNVANSHDYSSRTGHHGRTAVRAAPPGDRGRRDPGKQPWHVGSFLTFNGDFFLWNDWALDRKGEPVKVLAKIQPRCTIIKADADADQKVTTS